jgi:hypothetical protein
MPSRSLSSGSRLAALLVVGFLSLHASPGKAQPVCQVEKQRVNQIRIGESSGQLSALKDDFLIVEVHRPPMVRHFLVTERSSGKVWFQFAVDNHDRIIIAAVRGPCKTKHGIGVGSTLRDAMRTYGVPELSPSDLATT